MEWISGITQFFISIYESAYATFGGGLVIAAIVFTFIAVVAQWCLYEKAGQPGYTCLVPVLNVIVFLRILGRPAKHIWYFLIPGYNVYFLMKVYIELCHAFGKRTMMDYISVIVFNGFYILNLGLSYEEKYYGPVYNQKKAEDNREVSSTQLA